MLKWVKILVLVYWASGIFCFSLIVKNHHHKTNRIFSGGRIFASEGEKKFFRKKKTDVVLCDEATHPPPPVILTSKKDIESDKDKPVWVERIKLDKSRKPLAKLFIGQKLRGRIITVKRHGMFVDVGAQQDGFLHVKDAHKDYFVHNIKTQFAPGEDMDVWVQYVDSKFKKLRLQSFPVDENAPWLRPSIKLANISVGDCVVGNVTRLSEYGLFLDIGLSTHAYLHKRKMSIPKKQFNHKPWEIYPLHSNVTAYVYAVDSALGRVELTTYHPFVWDRKIPPKEDTFVPKADISEYGDLSDAPKEVRNGGLIKPEELLESGFTSIRKKDSTASPSTSSSSPWLRVLQRQKLLQESQADGEDVEEASEDINDDDLDEKDFEDDVGEELSSEEIRALELARRRESRLQEAADASAPLDDEGAEVGVDDETGFSARRVPSRGASKDTIIDQSAFTPQGHPLGAVEYSTDELFSYIGRKRKYLTVKEFLRWEKLGMYIEQGRLCEADIDRLIHETCGHGMMKKEYFDDFLHRLGDFLGLKSVPAAEGITEPIPERVTRTYKRRPRMTASRGEPVPEKMPKRQTLPPRPPPNPAKPSPFKKGDKKRGKKGKREVPDDEEDEDDEELEEEFDEDNEEFDEEDE